MGENMIYVCNIAMEDARVGIQGNALNIELGNDVTQNTYLINWQLWSGVIEELLLNQNLFADSTLKVAKFLVLKKKLYGSIRKFNSHYVCMHI